MDDRDIDTIVEFAQMFADLMEEIRNEKEKKSEVSEDAGTD